MPPIPSLTSQTLGWPKASSKMALLEQGVGVSSTMRCHGFEAPDPKPLRLFQSPAIKDFFPSLSLSSFSIVSDIIDRRSLCPRHGVGSRCRRKLPGLIHCRCGLMDLRCGPAAMSNTLLRRHRPEHQPCPVFLQPPFLCFYQWHLPAATFMCLCLECCLQGELLLTRKD
ncbi:uncharacterized protein LOC127773843 isoform X4 [Oryza glaberrima]|uniref:uncharacterized protein LOC127773843 isoform X4 n=1 Tax=Oryza glaberrima TaxID=4538 RepID=UPI00224C5ACA|nr:uncharacterized protein LOC127773843 isoform X4 [Oryza glaberrima]